MAKSFTAAMKEFFGSKPGSTSILDFAAELKALSHEEKVEFHKMLVEAGFNCDPPVQKTS